MGKHTIYSLFLSAVLILVTGCSIQEPQDASDPETSNEWIAHALQSADAAEYEDLKTYWFRKAYDHAKMLEEAAGSEAVENSVSHIPAEVKRYAMKHRDMEAFKWAFERGALTQPTYEETVQYWKLGLEWRNMVMAEYPEVLSIFMSEAIDTRNSKFFIQHLEEFKATGYKLTFPLETTEFTVRYRRMISEEVVEAMKNNDRDRIEFLIDHSTKVTTANYADEKTKRRMRDLGDYIFLELKDEELACKMVELRLDLNKVKIADLDFGDAFYDLLRKDPDYAVQIMDISSWRGAATEAEVNFLLTLSDEHWESLHALHANKAVEICMENGNTEGAMRFIRLREKRGQITRGEFTELLNWSLKYSNETVFDYVMKGNSGIDKYNIDLGALANNQELFEFYLPKIMSEKIYPTMDPHPRIDGTTIGRIYQIFENENEEAGLFIVENYDLEYDWEQANGGERTMLMDICRSGNLKAVKYLVENEGADILEETDYEEIQVTLYGRSRSAEGKLSAIFFAAESGNSELIKYLVEEGADVNVRSNFGVTPLMHAVSAGQLDAVKTFIALHANVNVQMNPDANDINTLKGMGKFEDIYTAYRRAKTADRQDILDVLVKAGARP